MDILEGLEEVDLESFDLESLFFKDNIYTFNRRGELVCLSISDKKLSFLEMEAICENKHLRILLLNGNKLKELPESIGSLENLQKLSLDSNSLNELPESISSLENLEELSLNSNSLNELPESISSLENLRVLYLDNNSLNELPESISSLENLEELSLNSNSLNELPESISSLENLRALYLDNNSLNELPESIGSLENLQRLSLSNNSLNELPESISSLENLEELSLNSNSLNELPESISSLENLEELSLNSNSLNELPESISSLENLRALYLDNNSLNELPESIGSLENLQRLSLSNNSLNELPESISSLENLEELSLNSNSLNELPESISSLENLLVLYLNSNGLKELPESIGSLENLYYIGLENNPIIKDIDDIESLSSEELITILLELQNDKNKSALNEVKILVVGNERVGKTSVINRLIGNEYSRNQSTTEGIDIQNYKLDNGIKVNIWDFAGQEITHQTHQFFLSKRSLYLLVLDAQKEDNSDEVYHWLNTIKTNGGDSPIIVVVNKRDKNRSSQFDRNRYREFNIVDILYLSCENLEEEFEHSIDDLKRCVENQTKSLDGVDALLPESWFNIKEEIENLNQQKIDYIEIGKYEEICEKNGVKEEDKQKALLAILNIIGTVVSYVEDNRLCTMQIINPMWVTNAVYKIIRSEYVKDGIFTKDIFLEIFRSDNNYKDRHFTWICDLLAQFQVAFYVNEERDKLLIPSKLHPNEPNYDVEFYRSGLNFLLRYKGLLKKSVISQLIVKMNTYIDKSMEVPFWVRGVFLEYEGSRGVVISEENKKEISISINTKDESGRELLSRIRRFIKEINDDTLVADELVPLVVDSQIVGFEDYDLLIDCEKDGDETIRCKLDNGKTQKFDVKRLLDGYKLEEFEKFNYPKLRRDLIDISLVETENRKAIFSDSEDETNDRFRSALTHKSYFVSDQSRGGESGSGKSVGERDLVIKNDRGITESVIEALILKSLERDNIKTHYHKLFEKYDTVGNKENFILSYVKTPIFDSLWDKYKSYFNDELKKPFHDISDRYSDKSNLFVGETKEGRTTITHIFINFYSE